MNKLNSIITFDLHIHSEASQYKDHDLVKESTTENRQVLLDKLKENNVSLFSITDHNRFNKELYDALFDDLHTPDREDQLPQNLLAGIEYDVKFEEPLPPCHLITIFNTPNNKTDFQKIYDVIQNDLLTGTDPKNTNSRAYYTTEEFWELLKKIELDTIIIACQRKDLRSRKDKGTACFSDSVEDPINELKIGYVDALEYKNPKSEGVLKNSLKQVQLKLGIVAGSDCHTWQYYPYHSKNNQSKTSILPKARMLPTFKGLMLALSSIETRFNFDEYTTQNYITGFKFGDREIPLSPGINVIIGENGSGKSTLMRTLCDHLQEEHEKKLKAKWKLEPIKPQDTKCFYVKQGQLNLNYTHKENTLLDSTDDKNFLATPNVEKFRSQYHTFYDALEAYITLNIRKTEQRNTLSTIKFQYTPTIKNNTYFIKITDLIVEEKTDYSDSIDLLSSALLAVEKLLTIPELKNITSKIHEFIKVLKDASVTLEKELQKFKYKQNVKNKIQKQINNYQELIKKNSNSLDKIALNEKNKLDAARQKFREVVETLLSPMPNLTVPKPIMGISQNNHNGFRFIHQANFHGRDLLDQLLQHLFTQNYQKIDKVKHEIVDDLSLKTAVSGINPANSTHKQAIDKLKRNFQEFITEQSEDKKSILDDDNTQIGNTLGEKSLAYYKYKMNEQQNDVVLIDQPEDNISNTRINNELIPLFQKVRNKSQYIFVTHNPLLVVNIDADNIVYLETKNNNLFIENGCLEYEDNETNILNRIAQNLDGGKEAIKLRLKIYGKNN